MVGAASRSTVAISGWLVLLSGMATGEGGGLPSASLVLRCGFGGGASSSPIVNYYLLASPAPIRHVRGSHFELLVSYRPLARLRSVPAPRRTQRGPIVAQQDARIASFAAPQPHG